MLGKMASTCELVARARYEAQKMDLEPLDRFIVGRRGVRAVV
jgi:hypothetical protein